MNVRMMPPQGPMGQPQPMGGAPAPMPPQGAPMGGPMPVPPMQGQPTAGQQKGQGLGSTFGGSASGRQGFKQFMAAKKQTSALTPQMPQAQMPMSAGSSSGTSAYVTCAESADDGSDEVLWVNASG